MGFLLPLWVVAYNFSCQSGLGGYKKVMTNKSKKKLLHLLLVDDA